MLKWGVETTHSQELHLLCWEGTCATLFPYTTVSTKDDNILKMHKNMYWNGMLREWLYLNQKYIIVDENGIKMEWKREKGCAKEQVLQRCQFEHPSNPLDEKKTSCSGTLNYRSWIHETTHAIKEVEWLHRLCSGIGLVQQAVILDCESQNEIFLEKNLSYHSKKKHIDVQYHLWETWLKSRRCCWRRLTLWRMLQIHWQSPWALRSSPSVEKQWALLPWIVDYVIL